MGDLPGFGGIWRTLVGEWEKTFNYFYICFWINGWRQGKMRDLPGVRGMWRTLVGQWEKNLIIFIFVFVFVFLFRSVFGFEDGGGRGATGERRSGRGGGGVEDVSRRVHDDRGWSRTIGDGVRGRGRSRTV